MKIAIVVLMSFHCGLAQERPAPREGKSPGLSYVISTIRKEAEPAWRSGEPWPRTVADFAQSRGWALSLDEVAKGLIARLHRDPAFDAYIKWQLLSFVEEDMSPLGAAGLQRIAQSMPKPIPQPMAWGDKVMQWMHRAMNELYPPDTRSPAERSAIVPRPVVGNGVVGLRIKRPLPGVTITTMPDCKEEMAARCTQYLEDERADVALRNESILNYRAALIDRAPSADGVRLALRIRDAAERLEAGEPTYKDVVRRLDEAIDELPPDLPPKSRQMLVEYLTDLGKMQRAVHDKFIPGKRSNTMETVGRTICVSKQDIDALIEKLSGTGD